MSIFFDFVRTSLLRSKTHYLLSRISKKGFFLHFFAQKNYLRKRSIIWQKPCTNPLQNVDFFRLFYKLHLSGLKSIRYYPEYQKMFLFGLFWLKKNIWKKVRFVDKNNGLTPLQNVDFLLLCKNFTFQV